VPVLFLEWSSKEAKRWLGFDVGFAGWHPFCIYETYGM
jgi:hypothetical protein